jgi:hypothetical protein
MATLASDRHEAGYICFMEELTDRPSPDISSDRPSPDISFEFGNDLTAPRAAREALQPLFPCDGELAANVGLVASELVSNVVLHTDDGGRMDAWDANPLRLEVRDHNPQLPVQATDHYEVGGRGLRIVAGVADRWGAVAAPYGKLIWAEFRR